MAWWLVAMILASQASAPQPSGPSKALSSMVAAEHAFAAATGEMGTRNGFLTFLAADAIATTVDPSSGAVRLNPARPRFLANPQAPWPPSSVLQWSPFTGQVSQDGLMGWLTGPYRVRDVRTGATTAQGAYVTVWRRQPDGTGARRVRAHLAARRHGPMADRLRNDEVRRTAARRRPSVPV
jgi:hypothetical protein